MTVHRAFDRARVDEVRRIAVAATRPSSREASATAIAQAAALPPWALSTKTRLTPADAAEASRSRRTSWNVDTRQRERAAEGEVVVGGAVGERRGEQDRVRVASLPLPRAPRSPCAIERIRPRREVRPVLLRRAGRDDEQRRRRERCRSPRGSARPSGERCSRALPRGLGEQARRPTAGSGRPPCVPSRRAGGAGRRCGRARAGPSGQRGWKRQPRGERVRGRRVAEDDLLPLPPHRAPAGSRRASACVYGCCGSAKSESRGACSTIRPRYMTAIVSAM